MTRILTTLGAVAALSAAFTCCGRSSAVERGAERVLVAQAPQNPDLPVPKPGETTTIMLPMRDGTRLATSVSLPLGEGPWPVLLVRTPYNRKGIPGEGATGAGCVMVSQDFRGRFDSEGECTIFLDDGWGERQDGYDTIAWVNAQPWCNGKIGTWGMSALAITQYMTAPTQPPGLVCQYAVVGTPDLFTGLKQGGSYRAELLDNWARDNNLPPHNREMWEKHSTLDDWWRQGVLTETEYARVNVPCYHVGGWYDIFSQCTLDAFTNYETLGGEGTRGNQRLLMGPWTHGGPSSPRQGELAYPENSIQPPTGDDILGMRWMLHWLVGLESDVETRPAVDYYVMGDVDDPAAPGNEWRTAETWPIPCEETPVYLAPDGTLSLEPPMEPGSLTYTYDPANPAPTVGGLNLTIPAGPMDQREIEARDDVLVFTSEPLDDPLEITGRVRATIHASSSCVDTDFTVKLTDVYPDGRSMLVLDGIVRARHRNSLETEEMLTPGEVYAFDIDLWSTSLVFNAGHRVRVAISSSNAPRFDPNPNTGAAFRSSDDTTIAENTIYFGPEHPTHVVLPVVR